MAQRNMVAIRTYTLPPQTELRIISTKEAGVTLRVLPGNAHESSDTAADTAEMFGAEMVSDVDYEVEPDARVAVFSWGGCTLQVRGAVSQEYVASNSAMTDYINIASALEARRKLVLTTGVSDDRRRPPRVLVTGAASAGKSSLCQILVNYAVRRGWSPCFVELDPRAASDKGSQRFLPGMIGACFVNTTEREEPRDPICFYFGHYEPSDDLDLYTELCRYLAQTINTRMGRHKGDNSFPQQTQGAMGLPSNVVAASGLVIDAPCEPRQDHLTRLVEIFQVDVVLVVDNPSMKIALSHNFGFIESRGEDADLSGLTGGVSVIGVPKGEGVVPTTADRLRNLRRYAWRNYFLGSHELPADPSSNEPPSGHVSLRLQSTDIHFVTLTTAIPLTGLVTGPPKIRVSPVYGRALLGLTSAVLGVSSATRPEYVPQASIAQAILVRSVEEVPHESSAPGTSDVFVMEVWITAVNEDERHLSSNYVIVPSRQLKWTRDLTN